MFNRQSTGFRLLSTVLAGLTVFFFTGQELSQAHAAERSRHIRLEEAAKNLRVPRERLADPVAWAAKERLAAADKRAAALEKMKRFAGQYEQEARASSAAREAKRIMVADPNAAVVRELMEGRIKGLSREQLERKLAKVSPALGEALRAASSRKKVTGPAAKPFSPERAKQLQVQPRAPRLEPLHGQLTPELRSLYAELVGQGARIERWDGSVVTAEDVLGGLRPPQVRLASLASDVGGLLPVMGALTAPGAEDLAETPETVRTPAIQALAASLGGRPVALYNHVHTKVTPELYYGSKKGAAATLDEGRGNDFDQASLLIALLRASGIPARYEYGTVRLSLEQAKALTGAPDAATAAWLLGKSGVPSSAASDGQSVLAERAWVRAHVSYSDYRGTGRGGEKLWVRLDPGLKRITHHQPVNLRGLVQFDFASYLSTVRPETPLELFEGQLLAAAKARNLCSTLEDAAWTAALAEESFRLLPAEHPAKVEQSLFHVARPPEAMRHKVELSLDGQVHAFELAELQARTLTLRYPGATAADEDAIRQAGGIANVVPYRVKVAPALVVEGAEVKRFAPVLPGTVQTLTVRTTFPATSPALAVHQPIAGSVYSLTVAPGWYLTLTKLADGYSLKSKHGIIHEFNLGGQLRSIAEPSGNKLTLVYQGNLLSQVKDPNGQVALSLTYQGNKIAQVTDRVNRVASYEYVGDDLVKVTDVIEHAESYAYDSAHNLVRRTDKRGKVWLSFHDILADRWVGTEDPLGHKGAAYYDVVNRRTVYVDKTGASWTREYNDKGNPVAKVDPLGNREEMTWDSGFNKLTQKDARGLVTQFQYDTKGNVLKQIEPNGRATAYTYDAAFSRVKEINNALLPDITNTIDSAGRLTSQWNGLGTTTYGYNARGQLTTITEPGSAITRLTYDANGNPETLTDATNGVTTLGFNPSGHLSSIKDPNNKLRTFEVDSAGQVRAVVEPDLTRTEFTYDDAGNQLTSKDPAGKVTTYKYDAAGRLTQVTDALGGVTLMEYDGEGRVVAQTDARGGRSVIRYDAAGHSTETTAADGATTSMAWCAEIQEQPCAVVDALGNLTTAEFDPKMPWVTTVTDALGRQSLRTYDAEGRLLRERGPGLTPTTYTYDGSRGVVTAMESGLTKLFYSYDARGNRTQVTDSHGGRATEYTYDLANRLLTEKNPLQVVTSYTYDAAGNRITKTDGNSKATTYTYDANHRLKEALFADGSKYEYAYDERGNRTLERSPSHERTLIYDELNRVKQMTDVTLGRTLAYTYDASGNRTSLTEGALSYTYAYDVANRLKQATDSSGRRIIFQYDGLGRRTLVSRPNGVTTTYGYDAAGQVLDITHLKDGGVLAGFAYTYDPKGNRLSKTLADGSSEVYQYDAGDRLTQVAYGPNRVVTYSLSAEGNATPVSDLLVLAGGIKQTTSKTGTFNTFNQLTTLSKQVCTGPATSSFPSCESAVATGYTYDLNGNLKTETTAGQVTSSYTWELDDRLRGVFLSGGVTRTYEYDANGLRTKQSSPEGVQRFLLDGPIVVETLDDNDASKQSYLTNPQGLDEILGLSYNGQAYWPLADALGSIVAITDVGGQVVNSFHYSVQGERTVAHAGPSPSFGFTGREHDTSRLRYHRDRYADSMTGRWLQPDRLGMVDGPNLYQYVRGSGSDPERWTKSRESGG